MVKPRVEQQDSCDADNETDDVFDEAAEHRIKTEKVQEQCEDNLETLHDVAEGNSENNLSNLNDALHVEICNVGKGNSSSDTVKGPIIDLGRKSCNVNKELYHKNVENNITETGKCLNDEYPDDVFDEEREKGEKKTARPRRVLGIERIITEIKIERGEGDGADIARNDFYFLLNAMKKEVDWDAYVCDADVLQESSDNEAVSAEDGERYIKPEFDTESEEPRIERNIDNMPSCSYQIGINGGTVNKCGTIIDIDDDSKNTHSSVEGRHKQPLKEPLTKKGKESQKDKPKNGRIKSSKQAEEINTNTVTESGDKFKEVANLNEAASNTQNSDRNNEQEGHVNKSCHSVNAKQAEIESSPEVNKNIWISVKEFSKIGFKHDTISGLSNVDILTPQITDKSKKSAKKIKRLSNRDRRTKFNKQFVGKAKNRNRRRLSLRNVPANKDNSEKVQEDSLAATVIVSKENYAAITENKEKPQTSIGQIETNINTELQEVSNKPLTKCCSTQTETLEISLTNVDDDQRELPNTHLNYMCTKCSFKAEHKAVMKRHLLNHGIEFSSTITSFFDVIRKAKLYTSQLEQMYDEKEPQTPNIIKNNNCENEEIHSEGMNKNVNNDIQFEKEESGGVLTNALQIQDVEICTNVPSRRRSTRHNYTSVNKKEDDVTNTENKSLSQSKEAFVNIKEKIVGKPTTENKNISLEKNCFSESEQSVKNDEEGKVNAKYNPSINIEYGCTKCTFKTKRRALLRRHLVIHGKELVSGIITFLDLVEDDKVSPNQFKDGEDEQVQIADENIEAENEVDILDDTLQNTIDIDAQSECGKKLENEEEARNTVVEIGSGSIKLIDNDARPKIVIKDNNTDREHTESIVINEGREEGSTNVDNKSVNVENKANGNECVEIPGTSKTKMKLRTKRKRRGAARRTSSPAKKMKVEVNTEKMYCCDKCSYQSDKQNNLNLHKITHTIKCDQCEFVTNRKRNLTSHKRVHSKTEEVKLHKCPQCPYQTNRNPDLRIHMEIHKKPEEEIKTFKCDKCPYQSKTMRSLKTHQLCHKSVNAGSLFKCTVCTYKTKEEDSLRNHMVSHQKEKVLWYKCEKCSYTTKYIRAFHKHSLVHKSRDEIKTYDCSACPYKAISHMLLDKDPKEVEVHECVQCSYKSIRKANLLAHIMRQHKSKEEIGMAKCGHCPYETKLKSNLRKHVKRKHNL